MPVQRDDRHGTAREPGRLSRGAGHLQIHRVSELSVTRSEKRGGAGLLYVGVEPSLVHVLLIVTLYSYSQETVAEFQHLCSKRMEGKA